MKKRNQLTCKRCGHFWLSSIEPKVCPNCHLDWRTGKTVVIQKKKKDILDYLDNLKKQYGRNVTIDEILEEIKRQEKEDEM